MDSPIIRRNTRQRQVILEELRKLSSHPTAAELHERVRRRLPRVSLSTVYRNLELLVEQGRAKRLDAASGQNRYDGDVDQHCHVRCVRCGRVDDAGEIPDELIRGHAESVRGYEILDWRLDLQGICSDCREKENRTRRS